MSKLKQLLINEYETVMLWTIVTEAKDRTLAELKRRHILRQDGGRNATRKYLGVYEEGLIEYLQYLAEKVKPHG